MKRILKFLLMPFLVFGPAMTVVACGEATISVDNQDILNSAVGQMRDHTFKMSRDLGLSNLPNDNSTLNPNIRNRIQNYYQDLVKEGNNWDYPTVAVTITANDGARFVNKYHSPLVNVRISLLARLQYKDLETNKPITIWIDNDSDNVTSKQKIEAVAEYLKNDYLNDPNFIFPFKTLTKDELTVADRDSYVKIEAEVRTTLFEPTTETAIIDLPGVDMSLEKADSANDNDIIFALSNPAIDGDNNITGTINNLKINLHFNNQSTSVALNNLKFVQQKINASNQIGTILNQPKESLQFSENTLPEEGDTFNNYDQGGIFSNKVKQQVFSLIAGYYPTTKMGSDWNQSAVAIGNIDSLFVLDDEDATYGYFIINLTFNIANLVDVSVQNIQLNLRLAA